MVEESSHEDILFKKGQIIEEGRDPNLRPKDEHRVGYSLKYERVENEPFIRTGASIITQPIAVGYGEQGMNTNPRVPIRLWPHRHHAAEYFVHFGIDPYKPDDLGGTIEFWVGDGDNATGFTFSKPATIYVPPGVGHLPCVFREIRIPFIHVEWLNFPIWSQGIPIPKVSKGFHLEGPKEDISKLGKYQDCFFERDISNAGYFPAHEGKAHVVLHHDMRDYETVPHYMEINMIYGSGIGWGLGDLIQYSDRQEISLPHKHAVEEMYLFLGTDKDHPDDLGGTVEFYMDDGSGEREYIINRPTLLVIPPYAVHEPLYVKELHSPFVTVAVLNMPVWAGLPTQEFPKTRKFFRG